MSWPTTPARFVLTEVDERGLRDGEDGELLSVSEYHGVVPRATSASQQAASEDTSHYKRCEPGQLVLNRLWAFRGGLGVTPLTGLVSPDYAVFDIDPGMDPRFVHYLTRSAWFVAEMTKRLRGIGSPDASNGRAPRINTDDLGRIDMFTPPIDVQVRVADRLDWESARIDNLAGMNSRLIRTVESRFARLIDHELEGLSGRRVPLRFLVQIDPGKSEVAALPDDTLVTFVPMEDVGYGGRLPNRTSRALGEVRDGYTYFRDGDVTIAKISPSFQNGKGGLAADLTNGIGFGTTELTVLRSHGELQPSFLQYVVSSLDFRLRGAASMHGVAGQQRIERSFIERFVTVVPSIEDQRRTVTRLNVARLEHDRLMARVTRQTSLLEQRRRSLITAAVTGQLAV